MPDRSGGQCRRQYVLMEMSRDLSYDRQMRTIFLALIAVALLVSCGGGAQKAKDEADVVRALCGGFAVSAGKGLFTEIQRIKKLPPKQAMAVDKADLESRMRGACVTFDADLDAQKVPLAVKERLLGQGGKASWTRIAEAVGKACPNVGGGALESEAAIGTLTSALLFCKVDPKRGP